MNQQDFFQRDFSPTILYVCKNHRTKSGFLHQHDYIELHFILSGQGKYSINGTNYPITAGDLVLLNPNEMHAHICNEQNPLLIFSIGFENIHLKGLKENLFEFPNKQVILSTGTQLREQLSAISFSMLEEKSAPAPGKYYMMRSYLTQMLILILRNQTNNQSSAPHCEFASSQKSYVVKMILNYMYEHYQEKVSLDEIAGNMYLSPVYISKVFKEETGDSPINHLIQIRLEKAKELMLTNPMLTVKEAAKSVGYDDAYYFSRLFKKYFGTSPSRYIIQQNNK